MMDEVCTCGGGGSGSTNNEGGANGEGWTEGRGGTNGKNAAPSGMLGGAESVALMSILKVLPSARSEERRRQSRPLNKCCDFLYVEPRSNTGGGRVVSVKPTPSCPGTAPPKTRSLATGRLNPAPRGPPPNNGMVLPPREPWLRPRAGLVRPPVLPREGKTRRNRVSPRNGPPTSPLRMLAP